MEKETKSVQVIQGKKNEGSDKDKYPKKEEVTKSGASEVGGRTFYYSHVVCPYCGTVRNIEQSDRNYYTYTCGSCGNTYVA